MQDFVKHEVFHSFILDQLYETTIKEETWLLTGNLIPLNGENVVMVTEDIVEKINHVREEKFSSSPPENCLSINEPSGSLKDQLLHNLQVLGKDKREAA